MIVAAVSLATTSILLVFAAKLVRRRMRPRVFAVVFTLASVAVAAATSGLLAMACWYGAARFGPIAAIGGWSPKVLANRTPVPLPVSVCAGVILAASAFASGCLWVRRIAELRSAQQTWATTDLSGITVTTDAAVDAFAVEGTATTRRVVLTSGLIHNLTDPALQQAVIEHERSHLRHHHLLYRLAVETAAAANPLLHPIRGCVNEALEAWADDDAAEATGHATVATAIATVALARTNPRRSISLAIADTSTARRVERLLTPEKPNRVGAIIGTGLTLSALIVLAVCCHQTETFFEALRTANGH